MNARNKLGKVVVCAAMKKLLQQAYGVLKSGQVFDAGICLASNWQDGIYPASPAYCPFAATEEGRLIHSPHPPLTIKITKQC
ncbi:hypothetical protein [Sodalis glossinidius]|uniref:hypothetical protein n=1 Tax=Sodalis glossinidius TaxID=63612 RepID=UPI003C7183B0